MITASHQQIFLGKKYYSCLFSLIYKVAQLFCSFEKKNLVYVVRFGLKPAVWTAAAAIYRDKNIIEAVVASTE